TMIISAPPMAAAFFQGTLGQFNSYSPFGHIKPEPAGHGGGGYGPPGSPTYIPPTTHNASDRTAATGGSTNPFSQSSAMALSSSGYQAGPEVIPQKDRTLT
ncbi:MAG TPA: hypothetical protein VGM71_09435, partial [Luteibacter sp.]